VRRKSDVRREDILRSLGWSEAEAAEVFKGKALVEVAEQDFVKQVVVGPTDPRKIAHPCLRQIAMDELIGETGALR